jgi:hypothetical protein
MGLGLGCLKLINSSSQQQLPVHAIQMFIGPVQTAVAAWRQVSCAPWTSASGTIAADMLLVMLLLLLLLLLAGDVQQQPP